MIDLHKLASKLALCPYCFSFEKKGDEIVISSVSDELSELIKIPKEALINHSIELPQKYTDIFEKAWNGESVINLTYSEKLDEILMKAAPIIENGVVIGIECACIPFGKSFYQTA